MSSLSKRSRALRDIRGDWSSFEDAYPQPGAELVGVVKALLPEYSLRVIHRYIHSRTAEQRATLALQLKPILHTLNNPRQDGDHPPTSVANRAATCLSHSTNTSSTFGILKRSLSELGIPADHITSNTYSLAYKSLMDRAMFASTEYQKLGRGVAVVDGGGGPCAMSDVGKPSNSALTVIGGTGATAQQRARECRKLIPSVVLLDLRRGLRWVEASERTLASDYMTGSGSRHDVVVEAIKPRLPYPMASCVPKLEPQLWGNEERLGKLMALRQLDREMAMDPGRVWPMDIKRREEIEDLENKLEQLGEETKEIRTIRVPKKFNPELEGHDPGMEYALTGSNMHPSSQWKSSYATASSPDLLYAYDKKSAERRLVPARKFSKHTKRREERRIYDYSLSAAAVLPEPSRSVLNGWDEASSVVTRKWNS